MPGLGRTPFSQRTQIVRLTLWALFFVLLSGQPARGAELAKAQEFLLKNWDQEDGLPSTRIDSIARTADGYIWLATYGGLTRFDGLRFAVFTTNTIPALETDTINCLFVDQQNTLWIGSTLGTLARLNQSGFTEIKLPSAAFDGKRINSIVADHQGALWLAFDEVGILRLQNDQFRWFEPTNDLPSGNVSQLLFDRSSHLWAVAGGELLLFENDRWQRLGTNAPAEPVRVISEASNGGLWVATLGSNIRGTRIFNFKNKTWEQESFPYPWPQNSMRSRAQAIFEDHQGRLWCATAGGGIFFRTAGEGWQRLASSGTLSQSDALCFMEDEGDVIWIGTRTAGLHQVRPRPVQILQLPADASQNVVLTVCATRDGSLWAGTEGAGIFHWHTNSLSHQRPAEGSSNSIVNVLLEDSHTNLWAGTAGGLFRLRQETFEPMDGSPAMRTPIMSLFEDRDGALWAGSRGGLIRIQNDDVRVFTSRDGLGGTPVRALAQDATGKLWVAIETAGIFRQTDDGFEPFTNAPAGLANGTRAIYCDPEGALWFATRVSGLFRLKDGNLQHWDNAGDGLPSDRFFALIDDDKKNLWLSSESGIFGCKRSMLNASKRVRSTLLAPWRLTQSDGLAYNVCTGGGQPAAARSADGRLWFGDGPSVVVFDPASVPHGTRVRSPIVEEVLADGQSLPLNRSAELRVKSGVVSLEFRYSSPNIISPQRLKFRYRLDGVDKQWVEPADARRGRSVTYSHLPPGHYRFDVQSAALDGEWSDAVAAALPLMIVPRFYERLPVQIAGGILLLSAVAVAAWRIERGRSRMRMERLKLQTAMEQERQRIARDIHDELGSGLTEIILLSDNLHDELPPSPGSEKMVGEISTRARALTRSMDEVVWAVNPRNDTLEGLLTYFNKFAQEYLARANIRCRLDVPLELPLVPLSAESRHHLYLACKEALNNCVKHSGASEVWIRLQTAAPHFVLSIEDNGNGFDPTQVKRGHGLQNMRRRLEELGGRCEIQNNPNGGTQVALFIIALPGKMNGNTTNGHGPLSFPPKETP